MSFQYFEYVTINSRFIKKLNCFLRAVLLLFILIFSKGFKLNVICKYISTSLLKNSTFKFPDAFINEKGTGYLSQYSSLKHKSATQQKLNQFSSAWYIKYTTQIHLLLFHRNSLLIFLSNFRYIISQHENFIAYVACRGIAVGNIYLHRNRTK